MIINKIKKLIISFLTIVIALPSALVSSFLFSAPAQAASATTPPDIIINEFVSSTTNPFLEWVELKNNTDAVQDLTDWNLSELTSPSSPSPTEIVMKPLTGIILPPMGQISVNVNGLNDAGDQIRLYKGAIDPANLIDGVVFGTVTGQTADISAPANGESGIRQSDLSWTISSTPTKTFYVDGLSGNDTTADGSFGLPYKTIAGAIADSTANNFITIGAGTYDEQLAVNKALTLSGADATSVIIQPSATPSTTYDFDVSAGSVILQNMTFDFNGADGTRAGLGMRVKYTPSLSSSPEVTIRNNILNAGKGQSALTVEASEVAIENNKISGDGASPTTTFGVGFVDTSPNQDQVFTDNSVSQNTFTNLAIAVEVVTSPTGIVVNNNQITDSAIGVANSASGVLDAQNNWWGSADPDFSALVSGSVDYSPWWTTTTDQSFVAPSATLNSVGTTDDPTPTFSWSLGGTPTPSVSITIDDQSPIALGDGATSYTPTTALGDGAHTWSIVATNATNSPEGAYTSSTDTFTIDTTAPVLLVSQPSQGQLFASATPSATYSATDATSVVYSVKVDGATLANHTSGQSLGTLTNGEHTLIVTATDGAGNSTAITRQFSVNTNLKSVSQTKEFVGGTTAGALNDIANTQIALDGITTTGSATIAIGSYSANPGSNLPSGKTAVGSFAEVQVTDASNITFPVFVKVYYTQAQLDSAGITESQIEGIYYFDLTDSTWKKYSDTGVDTSDVTIGSVVYSGFAWANADHFTPLVIGSDNLAPDAPGNLKAESQDGKVKLTWDKVADANGYKIRYREKTADDSTTYTIVTLTDGNTSETTVSGLDNGKEYEFGVAAYDSVGNIGRYAVVVQSAKSSSDNASSSQASAASAQETTTTIVASAPVEVQGTVVATPKPKSPESTDKVTPEEDKTEGKIKSAEDAKQDRNRSLSALAILLIAIGAGIAGYYGYEWWLENKK